VNFLQEKINMNIEEVREQRVVPNDGPNMLEALVETTEYVEDEDPVVDKQPQIGQSIGHALEFAAILAHREVSLYKIVEGSIEVKSMYLTITKELVLEPEPQVSRGVATFLNDLLKIRGDRVGEPVEDDSVHSGPT
jgi:hypothetical protein